LNKGAGLQLPLKVYEPESFNKTQVFTVSQRAEVVFLRNPDPMFYGTQMYADHGDDRGLGVIPVYLRKSATSVESAFYFEAALI